MTKGGEGEYIFKKRLEAYRSLNCSTTSPEQWLATTAMAGSGAMVAQEGFSIPRGYTSHPTPSQGVNVVSLARAPRGESKEALLVTARFPASPSQITARHAALSDSLPWTHKVLSKPGP